MLNLNANEKPGISDYVLQQVIQGQDKRSLIFLVTQFIGYSAIV